MKFRKYCMEYWVRTGNWPRQVFNSSCSFRTCDGLRLIESNPKIFRLYSFCRNWCIPMPPFTRCFSSTLASVSWIPNVDASILYRIVFGAYRLEPDPTRKIPYCHCVARVVFNLAHNRISLFGMCDVLVRSYLMRFKRNIIGITSTIRNG